MTTKELQSCSYMMRRKALKLALDAGSNGAHLGPAFSMMEIAAVLFCEVMHFSSESVGAPGRARFILSKAHAVLAYYTALYECGVLSDTDLETFEKNGTFLAAHPTKFEKMGVEVATGSLGMGLSFGVGCALAAKMRKQNHQVYVVLGDGECDEGAVWEAAMSAAHYKTDNLWGILDWNHIQYDDFTANVLAQDDIAAKWTAFGWNVIKVNGHDIDGLKTAFNTMPQSGKPTLILADTVKGKGVSFMENNPEWHHARLTQEQYDQAVAELDARMEKGDC